MSEALDGRPTLTHDPPVERRQIGEDPGGGVLEEYYVMEVAVNSDGRLKF